MPKPQVILADEPVSALDSGSAHAIMQLLKKLCRRKGIALLTVQHDPNLAKRYADRVLLLENGQITEETQLRSPIAAASHVVRDVLQSVTIDPELSAPFESSADQSFWRRTQEACEKCPDSDNKSDSGEEEGKIAVASQMQPDPAWHRTAWWALCIGGLLSVLGLSGWLTGLQNLEVERAGSNTIRFLGQLVPTAEQWGGIDWPGLGYALLQTLAMAILGTVAAITWSLPLAALAARGIAPRWLSVPIRLLLNVIRSVPSILWALLCVGALGLGAIPGMVALAAYSTGYLTKFFYEAFESTDTAVPTALRNLGMSGPETFVAAVWPASRLAIASSCVFMLEYNFRAASVLGVVGAGGIGYDLKLAVEWSNWHVVFVIVLALAASVIVFDTAADWIRRRLA